MATKSNFEQLIDLIKAANPGATTAYTKDNLTHEGPVVVEGQPHNTTVVVKGNPAVGFGGTVTFDYKRLDLATQLTTLEITGDITLHVPNDGAVDGSISSVALLPLFKAITGVELLAEDVVVEDIVLADSPDVTDYTLKVKADSLKWLGQVAVKLVEDAHDIASDLTVHTLAGFEYTPKA